MEFFPGFKIKPIYNPFGFIYGCGVFGPEVENRKLDDIRGSLMEPNCSGPDIVYSIAMDVGKEKDKEKMVERNLLFGVVTYAAGKLGKEPVRSQGHIHSVSKSCKSSTPEVYEIWNGEAIIYMQESAKDNPGRCFAVLAKPGDVVIVPPYYAHYTVSVHSEIPLTFGAWCVRDYGFDYEEIRNHNGLAYFPVFDEEGNIQWIHNDTYEETSLSVKNSRVYNEFCIEKDIPIYTQFENNPDKFLFVSNPEIAKDKWKNFNP
ncbi:glucose-6-phosphate isomerase family protein [Haloimpatiens massiliensis]|uniref:glucose-6-phosphate isomerase family protein n=1 Tax=Haloimpatiens massiliensis TaxID=1658110 RepID=UPI000C8224EF|nr:glucose-6-phosphate isomerase family protein [Haloimpatiens massiliensis]